MEKISSDPAPQLDSANKVTAPMYIVNPFKKKGQMKLSDLTSTHPPISERVRILRNLTHGASFKDYSEAYSNVTHSKAAFIPASAMTKEQVALRDAQEKAVKQERKENQARQIGDIMRKVNQFAFIPCACGLTMKIPPNFKGKNVTCPRCHKNHDIPNSK